jgi:hypothetical protein
MKVEALMESLRKLLVLLVVTALVCALASPVSPSGFAAILTPLFCTGVVLITLARPHVFDTCRVRSVEFGLPPASRAPPLG